MQPRRVPVHGGCRLRAPVPGKTVEIQSGDAVFTQRALKGRAAVHRFGGVVSHVLIVVLPWGGNCGHQVSDLRVKKPCVGRTLLSESKKAVGEVADSCE